MLHLYDSKSARVQPLTPVTPGKVGIYLCGATVQGSPHVGHLRGEGVRETGAPREYVTRPGPRQAKRCGFAGGGSGLVE